MAKAVLILAYLHLGEEIVLDITRFFQDEGFAVKKGDEKLDGVNVQTLVVLAPEQGETREMKEKIKAFLRVINKKTETKGQIFDITVPGEP